MTQETRVARIGIYTDKMVLSVMEQDGEGKSFCLYRKETQEDFLGKHGQVDREKLLLEAGKMMELSQKLLCDQTVCVGYGLLRYQPDDFRRELEQSLGIPVQTISGIRQAQAAKSGMMQTSQKDDTVGVFSSDLSTQIFMMDAQEGTEQSFPIGWRSVAQRYSGIIPNRMEEEELRREIRDVFFFYPDTASRWSVPNQGSGNGWTASICFAAFRQHRKKQRRCGVRTGTAWQHPAFFAESISALDAGFGTGKWYFPTEGVLSAFDFGIGSKINTGKKGDTLQNLPGRPSLQRGEISSKIILSKNLQMGILL